MQKALIWLNLYGCQAVWHKGYNRQKTQKMHFFACFRPYVRQPGNHIGWATSMPFASIYSTDPRTNPWNFREKTFRTGGFEKLSFFESAILNFFSSSFSWKSVTNFVLEWMGLNFSDYDGLQPKMTHTKH